MVTQAICLNLPFLDEKQLVLSNTENQEVLHAHPCPPYPLSIAAAIEIIDSGAEQCEVHAKKVLYLHKDYKRSECFKLSACLIA